MPSLGFGQETVGPLKIGSNYEFTASQNPNRAMRHRDDGASEVHMDAKTDEPTFVANSTWKIVKGLTGEAETVSFQSEDYPDRYIRHAGYVCWAHENDSSDLFLNDATFRVRIQDDELIIFESVNYPGHFLKIMDDDDYRVRITPQGGVDGHFYYREIL